MLLFFIWEWFQFMQFKQRCTAEYWCYYWYCDWLFSRAFVCDHNHCPYYSLPVAQATSNTLSPTILPCRQSATIPANTSNLHVGRSASVQPSDGKQKIEWTVWIVCWMCIQKKENKTVFLMINNFPKNLIRNYSFKNVSMREWTMSINW